MKKHRLFKIEGVTIITIKRSQLNRKNSPGLETIEMNVSYDEANYILNESGEIDVNYYISKAHISRNEAIRDYGVKLSNSIKAGIDHITSLFQTPKAA